jgi:hypothetical protein
MDEPAVIENKIKPKKIIVPMILLLVFLGILAGGYFLFGKDLLNKKKETVVVEKTETSSPPESPFSRLLTSDTANAGQYPYFPENTETFLDEAKTFQMKAFQPIFKEFIAATPTLNYLVVDYPDTFGETLKETRIPLRGQILYAESSTDGRVLIGSLMLKDLLKPGDQFGIYYLSSIPSDFSLDMPYCQIPGQEIQKTECVLAFGKQLTDKQGENIFYPLFVYKVLKQ